MGSPKTLVVFGVFLRTVEDAGPYGIIVSNWSFCPSFNPKNNKNARFLKSDVFIIYPAYSSVVPLKKQPRIYL